MRRAGLNCILLFDESPCSSFTSHTLPEFRQTRRKIERCVFRLEASHGVRLYGSSRQHLASSSKMRMAISETLE